MRLQIAIVGESGGGLLTTGSILLRALRGAGYWVMSEREFPSLIKGGESVYRIAISDQKIYSVSQHQDVLFALDKKNLRAQLPLTRSGGLLVHGYERLQGIAPQVAECEERQITVAHAMARQMAEEQGGSVLMKNMVLLGLLWKAMGLTLEPLAAEVTRKFASKPKLLEIDLKCLQAGYDEGEVCTGLKLPKTSEEPKNMQMLDGNHALALGATRAGVRAYYGYPMSPSTSVLVHMQEMAEAHNILHKQVEDELTAANMCLGSMYAGTRALTATSGGGYDLMSETISLSGMTETPLVIINAQRPGPATGLPTWTAQGDLRLALHAGHGDFARGIVAVSSPEDAYSLMQHALNYADLAQTAVTVLTDKQVAENVCLADLVNAPEIEIQRGLHPQPSSLESSDRYDEFAPQGVSSRWVPTRNGAPIYFCNGDEHGPDGRLTEDAIDAEDMQEKRLLKEEYLKDLYPEPEYIGDPEAEHVVVCWGSAVNALRDAQPHGSTPFGILHYTHVWPLRTDTLLQLEAAGKTLHLVEGNAVAQFGGIITQVLGGDLFGGNQLLITSGRSITLDDILGYFTDFFTDEDE